MNHFLRVLLLRSIVTINELFNDRFGETLKDKKKDVYGRVFLTLAISAADAYTWYHYFANVALTFGIFVMFFDYGINILFRRADWFTYLGTSTFDNLWRTWNPWLRFGIRVVILLTSILIYTWT